MDKQQNRKKRRSRGEGVTSYRVTSSLTLTDEAYQHAQKSKQHKPAQAAPDPYAQAGYPSLSMEDPQQGYYQQQQGQGYDQNQSYYDQQGQHDPNQAQGYYDQNQGYEQQYDPNQAQGYYDQNQGYQQQYDPNQAQGYYDQNQGYPQQYDPNQQGYYDQQGQYDPNQQGYYDQGYQQPYDPNQQGYYDQQYDPNQAQGYYDQNQGYEQQYDPNQAQGYYDQNQGYQQQYDPNQQGYYDQQGQYDPNQQGYYDQGQGYYDQQYDPNQQGYYDQQYDPNQQGYYDQQGQDPYYAQAEQAPVALPPRKRKIESVGDYYSQMLGEGHVFATDSDDSPHHETVRQEQAFYQKQYQSQATYPPHLVPQSPLVQTLGPAADIFFKLREKWYFIKEKLNYYMDMLLDLQESVQKELKEAAGMAFKGFMDQMRQRSPIALPYQAAPGAPGGPANQAGYPVYVGGAEPQQPAVSFVDLHELNVEFTDNYDQPLFDFSKYANSQYKVSKQIADPAASESALWAIRECAARAGAIPPAQEGPYANLPLTEVMNNITEQDLQAFLRYVKAYPGNYVSRSLKISETFATWVVYGAPQP